MKFLILPFLVLSAHAMAVTKTCISGDHKLTINYDMENNVQVAYSFKDSFTSTLKGVQSNIQRNGSYTIRTYTLTDQNSNTAVLQDSSYRSGGRAKSTFEGISENFTKLTYLGEESYYEKCH